MNKCLATWVFPIAVAVGIISAVSPLGLLVVNTIRRQKQEPKLQDWAELGFSPVSGNFSRGPYYHRAGRHMGARVRKLLAPSHSFTQDRGLDYQG